MATRIDGKALAAKVKAQVAEEAAKLPRQPGLAVVLVAAEPGKYSHSGYSLVKTRLFR